MRRRATTVLVAFTLVLSGCAVIDRDVRDQRACAAIESLGGSPTQVAQIRSDALPEASARLGRSIHEYVRLSSSINEGRVVPTPGLEARSQRLQQEIQTRCIYLGALKAAGDISGEANEPTAEAESSERPQSSGTSESTNPSDVIAMLNSLTVAPEDRSGYDRDLFTHWIDLDGNGCNSRFEVLIAESLQELEIFGECELVGGEWVSVYDGVTTSDPSDFDIDHLVPLAEAWDSGASEWEPARREAFANALDTPEALVAVSASSNRSKSDKDPAEWLPPDESYWCEYATDWVSVKSQWELSVDDTEKAALLGVLEKCG